MEPKQGAEITFGSGSLAGYFVHDTFTLGNCEGGNTQIAIKN